MTHTRTPFVTRFAPSPTGRLHKGHAYSALMAYRRAQAEGGRFLLRIEDIDTVRCRDEYVAGIYEDLHWLGLDWETPVRRQSEHFDDYQAALTLLNKRGFLYPCFCTRKEIAAEIARAPSAPHGPDGPLYPGTCRHKPLKEQETLLASGMVYAWRLNLEAALRQIGGAPVWRDELKGTIKAAPESLGDVVLARKDSPTSYHLSVVLDDARQGISHVIRGEDLFHATHIHVVLQRLMGLNTPVYHHHGLLLDEHGRRFAKRNLSVTLADMRASGISPEALAASLLGA